jgi:hypothetical protein
MGVCPPTSTTPDQSSTTADASHSMLETLAGRPIGLFKLLAISKTERQKRAGSG